MKAFPFLLLTLLPIGMQAQTTAVGFHSTNGNYWKMKPATVTDKVGTAQVVIRTDAPQQTFKGWGTCFNELDYDAWSLLSETDRTLFTKRVFNPNGDLRLTVGRIPVGASDYACDWYSCDETTADGTNADGTANFATDFAMEHFTIARDRTKIIPSIKEALSQNPGMTFWASPWSPPQWMKTNKHYAQRVTSDNGCPFGVTPYDNDQFIDDKDYYNAYCLYFDKFIQAYKAEGINITGLAYQNEAYSNTPYPGCSWTAATTAKFLGKYLGPYMAQHRPGLTLIVGTMNTNRYDVFQTILSDDDVARYCKQVGFQWEGGQRIGNVREDYPGYELVQTESECGSGTFDWNAAAHTFQLCNHYLAGGVTTYTYWNAILQDKGVSHWGWVQNALVRVNSTTHTATYCPEYYAYKHYTHLIPAGSQILTCDESNLLTSALTPDGNVIVIVGNDATTDKTLTVEINDKVLICEVAAKSFASYVVGTEATVAKVLKSEAQGLVDVEAGTLGTTATQTLSSAIATNTYDALFTALTTAGQTAAGAIVNPSFATDADGWNVANQAASADAHQGTVLGRTCYNNWSNNFTSMNIYQDVYGLQAGLYTVSAKSVCGGGNINDQHVYAETSTHIMESPVKTDDVWDANNWETQTTPRIYVAEGDYLRVGYASTSGGGTKGWFCVTDFELTRVGDLTDDFDLTVGRKADALQTAKDAYLNVAEQARLLAVNEAYVESYREQLSTLIADQRTTLASLTIPALVQNLQRELEAKMEVVRAHSVATAINPSAVAAGTFLLYDLSAGKFFTYNPSSTNFPALSDDPTRMVLSSNGEGTYAIKYVDVNYLKIGVSNVNYIFGDATDAANTKWVFTPVDGKTNTYTISTSEYAEKGTTGTYYINGSNATTTAAEAHEFILVSPTEYVRCSGNATCMVVSPAITNATTSGWSRDNNNAKGYAENPAAIQSDAHNGYGISHWRGSAITNSKLIYQSISDLPAGTYKLEAYAAATVFNNNSGADNREGVSLFAAGSSTSKETAVTTATYAKYTVYYTLDEGETMTIGLRAGATNANNWVFLSDVTLTYCGQRLVLDENYTEAPEGENVDVLLQRTFYQGWNTLVLPFNLSSDELTELFGDDAETATLTSAKADDEGNLQVRFTKQSAIAANTPCLLYVGKDLTISRTLKNKNVSPAANPTTAGTALSFVGTYTAYAGGASPLTTSDYILAAAETFKHATQGHAIKAYRAYLKANEGASVKANVIHYIIDNQETGIGSVVGMEDAKTDNVFDLTGRRVRQPRHGLYIVNGVKTIVK